MVHRKEEKQTIIALFDEYQVIAGTTANPNVSDEKLNLATMGLGIAGEAGEVADLIKKYVGHGHELDKEKLIKECGDVVWYVARIASALGVNFSVVAQTNVDKLKKRYPNGFSSEASINRNE